MLQLDAICAELHNKLHAKEQEMKEFQVCLFDYEYFCPPLLPVRIRVSVCRSLLILSVLLWPQAARDLKAFCNALGAG
jgi:hypothetical protein